VVEIEQSVHLRRMDAELAGQISFAGLGFDHGAVEFKLGRHNRWKSNCSLAAP
jgi:hypothetical protein